MPEQAVQNFPLIAVRNTIIFPSTSLFLVIGRALSVKALKVAQESNGHVVVSAQIPENQSQDEIIQDKIYKMGTLCEIRSVQGNDRTGYQILVTGVARFRISEIVEKNGHLEAMGNEFPDVILHDVEIKALAKNIQSLAKNILDLLPGTEQSVQELVAQIQKEDELVYRCASYLKLDVIRMQELLVEEDIKNKMKKVLEWMRREREVLLLEKDIKGKVGERLNTAQREILLREQMQAIKDELGESKKAKNEDLAEKIKKAEMPEEVEKIALDEFERLTSLTPSSPDYQVIENYLDWLCSMPWKVSTDDTLDIEKSEQILDKQHYGLAKIKRRIIEHLAVTKFKQNLRGPILCLVGPPGVGKTSLGKSIAEALGRKFIRVSLGGVRDTSDIRGHRRTYIGSMPGRIIQSIKRIAVNNPLMMLDEIDKLGVSFQGDPSSAMLEVLDPEQNSTFVDHFLDVPFDLSKVFFIATANRVDTIPAPLRDRMEIIELTSYSLNEKKHIAERFIFPAVLDENGLSDKQVAFLPENLELLIQGHTREPGVRELKRVLSSLCRAAAYDIGKGALIPIKLDRDKIEQYLGPAKFLDLQKMRKWVPGLATGLAWTPVGGEVLFIESLKVAGKGNLKLTGQLGDVMKESAEIALSYICSRLLHLNSDFDCKNYDIHLHIPAGAIPKDGPSAGSTLAVCLASLILNKKIDKDLAMTGELTLSGSILPVGGIKEKVLAAHRYNIKKVVLPRQNENDLREVPDEIKKDLEFFLVDSIDQILELALGIPPEVE